MALAATAMAQTPPAVDPGVESKRLYSEGTQAYNLGEFLKAVDLFKEAYKVKADPVFLFNIAQSLRLSNQYEQAALFYRSFLRNMPQAPNKAEVETRIKEMDEAAIAKKKQDEIDKANEEKRLRDEEDRKRKQAAEDARNRIPDPSKVTLDADGNPIPQGGDTPKPIYKKWWFWGGIGAVAVGVVVVAVVASGGGASAPDATYGNSAVF